MNFTVDSNYLICLLQSWNPHHIDTLADLESRLDNGHQLHLIPHTLLEAYSVMTRMPDPFRKPPALVLHLLVENFSRFPLTPVPASTEVWRLLDHLGAQGVGGGTAYDRWIAFSAHHAGMDYLLTWNTRHFLPNSFAPLTILSPGQL